MATLLAGTVYQRGISRHGDLSNTCYGADCFQLTFEIIAGLAGISVILSFVLWQRSRAAYSSIIEQQVTERQRRGIQVRLLSAACTLSCVSSQHAGSCVWAFRNRPFLAVILLDTL